MGITRPTPGRSLGPARPIPAAEDASDPRAAKPRAAARVGRVLAAGDVGSGWLRLRPGAAHHGLAPAGVVVGGCAGGRLSASAATERAPSPGAGDPTQTPEPGSGGRCGRPPTRPTCCRAAGLAGRPPPRRRRLPQPPDGARRAESHSLAEARGAPSLLRLRGAAAVPRLAWLDCELCRKLQAERKAGKAGGTPEPAAAGIPPLHRSPTCPRARESPGGARLGGRGSRGEGGWAPGAPGSAARTGPPPPPAGTLGSQTPSPSSLPPVTPLPLLCLLSLPFPALYAILRD